MDLLEVRGIVVLYAFLLNLVLFLGASWNLLRVGQDHLLLGYLISLYGGMIFLSGRELVKDKVWESFSLSKLRRLWIVLCVGLCIAIADILIENAAKGIWVDEYFQMTILYDGSLVWGAAEHQQMPSDYVLSWINHQLFGFTELSFRGWAMLSYGLGVLFLVFLSHKLYKSIWSSVFALCMFFGISLVREYAVEARPTHLALLWSIIYVGVILEWLKLRYRNMSILLVVTLTFLLTTGLQPLFILGSLCIATWIFYRDSGELKKLFAIQGLSLALVSPFVWKIYSSGIPLEQFHGGAMERLGEYVSNFSVVNNYALYFEAFGVQFLTLIVIALLAYFIFNISYQKLKVAISLLVAFFIFILIYDIFFVVKINWNNYQRYFLTLSSLIVFSGASLGANLGVNLGSKLDKSKQVVLILVLLTLGVGGAVTRYFATDYIWTSIKQEFNLLKRQGNGNDFALRFSVNEPWPEFPFYWASVEIYYREENLPRLLKPKNRPDVLKENLSSIRSIPIPMEAFKRNIDFKVFFVSERQGFFAYWEIWERQGLPFRKYEFANSVVLELPIPKVDGLVHFKRYYSSIVDEFKGTPQEALLGRVYDNLIAYAFLERNQFEFKRLTKQQMEIDYFNGRAESEVPKIQKFVELRRQVYNKLEKGPW